MCVAVELRSTFAVMTSGVQSVWVMGVCLNCPLVVRSRVRLWLRLFVLFVAVELAELDVCLGILKWWLNFCCGTVFALWQLAVLHDHRSYTLLLRRLRASLERVGSLRRCPGRDVLLVRASFTIWRIRIHLENTNAGYIGIQHRQDTCKFPYPTYPAAYAGPAPKTVAKRPDVWKSSGPPAPQAKKTV